MASNKHLPKLMLVGEKQQEIAPPHSITSSARNISEGGRSGPVLSPPIVDDQLERRWLFDRQVAWFRRLTR
jgi:hypothetical protein